MLNILKVAVAAAAARGCVPPRVQLALAQYRSFRAGSGYVNHRPAATPVGEIQVPLLP